MKTTVIKKLLDKYFSTTTSSLPLAIYRMAFGFLMCFSLFRFIAKGWVETCFLKPEFHFTFQFFSWIQPFENPILMYSVVVICAIAALFIGLGFLYRISTITFFILFAYLELIEQSWYLNHYYFITLIAFLLCLIPAHQGYSIDAKFREKLHLKSVPSWTISILKLQISIVYFYAGIAKLKSDWLVEAMPLKIWLTAKSDLPIIGTLLQYDATAYFFSYFGLIYDLTIPFLLWSQKTKPYAFIAVIVFHVSTALLFDIGMFPWIMIAGSTIFITASEWKKILKIRSFSSEENTIKNHVKLPKLKAIIFIIFFFFQLTIPLRYLLYNENDLWTERNFRFSWNVMLMEKSGLCFFTIKNKRTGEKWKEYPSNHLSYIQEKQMSFQPDMIWQYAQFLNEKYNEDKDVIITVDSYVSLNGRPSREFIPKNIDLLTLKRNEVYDYVISYE